MARPAQQTSVSDDDIGQLDQSPQETDDITSNSREVELTSRKNTFKSRRSVLDNENDKQPTFWSIDSFDDTATWTGSQQAYAIQQAQQLATHYIKIHNEHTTILTMIQSQQARIETLDQDIHNPRGDNDDLEQSTTHNTKGRARLEDPDKFSRKKGHQPEFETWKSNIETKLKVDSRLFDDKNHKISYVYSRTTNEAQDHIRDRVDNDHFDISWGSTFGSPIIFGDFGGRESQVRVPCLMC
ncbi:uncharacterized protein K444DRAFT_691786, partial [Hyaloscypha bicolor E]